MRRSLVPLAFALCLTGTPAQAQMDWLTPHLEAKRWGNVQRRGTQPRRKPAGKLPVCTESMVPRAEMRRVRAGYDQRRAVIGHHRAQLWVNGQARQARLDLIRRGVCR